MMDFNDNEADIIRKLINAMDIVEGIYEIDPGLAGKFSTDTVLQSVLLLMKKDD